MVQGSNPATGTGREREFGLKLFFKSLICLQHQAEIITRIFTIFILGIVIGNLVMLELLASAND
jgi:hypothetical protein